MEISLQFAHGDSKGKWGKIRRMNRRGNINNNKKNSWKERYYKMVQAVTLLNYFFGSTFSHFIWDTDCTDGGVFYSSCFSTNWLQIVTLREGADKSLALPGRKQATATKLGIYSTYSPTKLNTRLSPLLWLLQATQKIIQKVVRPTRSPRQQWAPRRKKNGDLSIVSFFSPGNRC